MKIVIASDHAGFNLKQSLKQDFLPNNEFLDLGTDSTESVDYPDYAKKLGTIISDNQAEFGILICGSGVGISIAANRNPDVRAALCHNVEIARLARQHNDANVLVLGARFMKLSEARDITNAFLSSSFEGGRHQKRVNKLRLS